MFVNDNYLSIAMNGTFEPIGYTGEPKETSFADMPIIYDFGRDLQVFLSEYSLQTLINSIIENNWVQYVSYMTGDEIDVIIEDFSDIFGYHDYVKVVMKASPIESLSPSMRPKIKLSKDVSSLEFYGDIQIMNPYDETVPTLVL